MHYFVATAHSTWLQKSSNEGYKTSFDSKVFIIPCMAAIIPSSASSPSGKSPNCKSLIIFASFGGMSATDSLLAPPFCIRRTVSSSITSNEPLVRVGGGGGGGADEGAPSESLRLSAKDSNCLNSSGFSEDNSSIASFNSASAYKRKRGRKRERRERKRENSQPKIHQVSNHAYCKIHIFTIIHCLALPIL